jgi:hypothetical protein
MTSTQSIAAKTTSVIAEHAPIGVQLWPTLTPKSAPNFTLTQVAIVRTAYGSHVEWTYENGSKRSFKIGDTVTVQYC